MKKLILLALVCTGFAVTTPLTAQALDSDKIAQYDRDQYRDNQYRDNQNRDYQYDRNRNRDRQFSVYYRNRNDRQWTLESNHDNRRDAQRAANRLERRGYLTYVQVSREVNRGMNRG
ncbi:hypothetical protein [Chamaesiphon sp. VAR_69_metabat_338]|uniref:hypothetical protein n=1 Tax=Chamaesiphon sp. VAR_69_metabat_338 TaxID=2964704 RepID=UPI00286DBCD7|nr:hypothetical protein [Chamaesiphon sp. VAR_69_metabat_338]